MVDRETVFSFNFYSYGKPFTGSDHGKRYRIVKAERELPPDPASDIVENDPAGSAAAKKEQVLAVCIWPEPFSYEHTGEEKKTRKDFPYSEEGLESAVDYINSTDTE